MCFSFSIGEKRKTNFFDRKRKILHFWEHQHWGEALIWKKNGQNYKKNNTIKINLGSKLSSNEMASSLLLKMANILLEMVTQRNYFF